MACQRSIAKFEALHFGVTLPLSVQANEKPFPSPVKKKQVPVSVFKLVASVWADHGLYNFQIPEAPHFRQLWGIEITGSEDLLLEWYKPEAKLAGRSAVRQSGSIAHHTAQPEASTTPANPET